MRAASPRLASCIIRQYGRSQHRSVTVRFSSLTSCPLSPSWRAPPIPAEFNGNAIQPVEGESFLPALTGRRLAAPKAALLGARGQSRRPHRRLETGQQTPGRLGTLQSDRRPHRTQRPKRTRARARRQNARLVPRLGSSLRSARLAPVLISPAAAPTCCTGEPVARPRSPETCRGDTCVALYYPKTVRATLGSPFMTPKL